MESRLWDVAWGGQPRHHHGEAAAQERRPRPRAPRTYAGVPAEPGVRPGAEASLARQHAGPAALGSGILAPHPETEPLEGGVPTTARQQSSPWDGVYSSNSWI